MVLLPVLIRMPRQMTEVDGKTSFMTLMWSLDSCNNVESFSIT